MRKNLYLGLIACAALTMTGCSNDEISYDSSKQEAQAIQFDTYLGKNVQGRASELSTDNLKNFGVFASYTAGKDWENGEKKMNFMFNQKVENISSNWVYTPLKYWPEKKEEKISFFAYAPYLNYEDTPANSITPPVNTATDAPVLEFSISKDVKKMVDFTAGVQMDVVTKTNQEDKVSFKLHHELARVNFAAKLDRVGFGDDDDTKTKVNITDVKIDKGNKLVASAKYQFATINDGESTYTKGTWKEHAFTTEDLIVTSMLNKVVAEDLGDYNTKGVFVTTNASETPLFSTGQYLFFIPTPETGISESDMVNVTITYDIVTADTALDGGYVKSTATKTVGIKASNFVQGKAKKYVFEIGLHEIKVKAEVENWKKTGANTTVNGGSLEPTA